MIVTLTPNPSIDLSYELSVLDRGEVNRALALHQHAGGKGINVARALVSYGVSALAVMPVGSQQGQRLAGLLNQHGVPAVTVPVSGDVRTNITITERDGATTKINAAGPTMSSEELDRLVQGLEAQLGHAPRYLVCAGSLPPGAAPDFYARVTEAASPYGVPVVLDTSGEALRTAVEAGGLRAIKPNLEELAELVGSPLLTVGDVLDAARDLLARGIEEILISLGEHGALLVVPGDHWWAGGPALTAVSTVGAGDVTLAGYLAEPGSRADRLVTAVAWGRAAVMLPGSAVPARHQIDPAAVRLVPRPDPYLSLKEIS